MIGCIVFNKIDLKKDSLSLNVVEALRCEFHDSNGEDFGDISWTNKLIYFSSTVEPLLYDHPQNHIGVVA